MENKLMKQPKHSGLRPGMIPWKPGQSGNPAGRPLSARTRISEKLIADIADVWETYGKNVLVRLAATDPAALAKIAYGLLPRDVFISVEQRAPGNLDPDEWATLREIIDTVQANAPSDAERRQVLDTIANALRSEYAKEIEGN